VKKRKQKGDTGLFAMRDSTKEGKRKELIVAKLFPPSERRERTIEGDYIQNGDEGKKKERKKDGSVISLQTAGGAEERTRWGMLIRFQKKETWGRCVLDPCRPKERARRKKRKEKEGEGERGAWKRRISRT